jgi:hypothetical protein
VAGLDGHLVQGYGQPQARDAGEERAEGDLELGAGEVLPQALMDAVAEADVFSYALASRFISVMETSTASPALTVSPPTSMSSLASRTK